MPIRLTDTNGTHLHFMKLKLPITRCSTIAPYTLSLATKMMEVAEAESLDLLHVHYAIPHSVSALLARMMAAPRRCLSSPRCTARILRWSETTAVTCPSRKFSIEQSDGVTAISHYLSERTLEEFDIKRPIEVIPNFVNCDLYMQPDDQACAREWAPDGEPILMHLSNFRPVKRITDVVEIFALVREKIPAKLVMIGDGPDRGAAEYLVRKKKLSRRCFFLGKQDRVHHMLGLGTCFCCRATWNRSASPRLKRWPAKCRWWRPMWAGCRKWSPMASMATLFSRGMWRPERSTRSIFSRVPIAAARWQHLRA